MSDKERGLYPKFRVERTDSKSAEGEKHWACEYFVLDATHDPIALVALAHYSDHARLRGYTQLADDLDLMIGRGRAAQRKPPPTDAENLTREYLQG